MLKIQGCLLPICGLSVCLCKYCTVLFSLSEIHKIITVLVENVNMFWKTDLFWPFYLCCTYPCCGILPRLMQLPFSYVCCPSSVTFTLNLQTKAKGVFLSFFSIKICGNYLQVAVSAAAVVFTLWTSLVPRGLSRTHMTRRNLNKYVVRRIMVSVIVIFL